VAQRFQRCDEGLRFVSGRDFSSATSSQETLVIPSGERSSAKRTIFRSRGTCCSPTPSRPEGAPFFAHFAKSGIPRPNPSEDSATPRPGRARLRSRRRPQSERKSDARSTVEERRGALAPVDVGLPSPIPLRIRQRHDREGPTSFPPQARSILDGAALSALR
jgi:hypothetical protein